MSGMDTYFFQVTHAPCHNECTFMWSWGEDPNVLLNLTPGLNPLWIPTCKEVIEVTWKKLCPPFVYFDPREKSFRDVRQTVVSI